MSNKEDKPDSIREKELWKSVFSTPSGRELIQIWETKLTRVKSFHPEMTEAHCRYVAGRYGLMIDIIKATKGD